MTQHADLILMGENIFVGEERGTLSGFVAIKSGKIIAVEEDPQKRYDHITPETHVIDCGDHFIMPGFHDCHVHIVQGGIANNGVQLGDCKSEDEAAKRVGEYAQEHPELPWILGSGWYHIYWNQPDYPTKESLDKYVSDRPVFLENEDGHGAWVNSKALELCGINSNSTDPKSGTIFKDSEGLPTGYLDELAMLLCGEKAYDLPVEYERKLIDDFIYEASRNGITSVNDMRPFFSIDLGRLETYEELDRDGNQPLRINFTTNLFEPEKAKTLKAKYNGGKLHFAGVKEFIDGVAISYTSYLLEDYSDKAGCRGFPLIPKDELEKAISIVHCEEIPIRLHVTGDAAVRMVLDAIEKARDEHGCGEVRHSLEHIDLIDPADVDRINEMNVVASMQPPHMAPTDAFKDNPYPARFGEKRSRSAWPINTIKKTGATVAFGTDFPVAELNPMEGIYRAVTRRSNDGTPVDGWNPGERVSVAEALGAYTLGSAKMIEREDKLGTLETGKYGDITVLDRNPLVLDPEEIRDIKVVSTICDGKVVYTA